MTQGKERNVSWMSLSRWQEMGSRTQAKKLTFHPKPVSSSGVPGLRMKGIDNSAGWWVDVYVHYISHTIHMDHLYIR